MRVRMKVAKFGGSSLATPEQVQKVCSIIEQDDERSLIVVSAPGRRHAGDTKVTDLLIECALAHLNGRSVQDTLQGIVHRYAGIARSFHIPDAFAEGIEADLHRRLHDTYESDDRFMDAMKAAGEDHNARLIAEVMRARGVEAHYVNPGDGGMLLSDEAGQARIMPSSYDRLKHLRDRPGISIFPGFFGYTDQGHVVTFRRGGSDITGAILAAAVHADVYENFTDVDSVLAANPAVIDQPEPITVLTYQEMRELSYAGFSVFHDEALEPVVRRCIPIHIRNTNNPDTAGTLIVKSRKLNGRRPVVGIAAMDGFCSVYIYKYLMNRAVGFGRRVLQVFEEAGIPYEHTPSGIDNMSVIVHESVFTPDRQERVVRGLQDAVHVDDVSVERGIALIMIVGEGMRHAIGLTGRAGSALGGVGVNIEMINQGSSEVSMMFGVKAEDMNDAVRSLYAEFFSAP